MEVTKTSQYQGFLVRIPLTENETKKLKEFLLKTGRKAGPWLRNIILRELAPIEGIGKLGIRE